MLMNVSVKSSISGRRLSNLSLLFSVESENTQKSSFCINKKLLDVLSNQVSHCEKYKEYYTDYSVKVSFRY